MGDHPERKLSMPPIGFTSVVLPQPHHHHHEHPSLSATNHQADGGGGGYGGCVPQVPKRNLAYSRTQMRDCRGNDSDSDSESESDPDLDPATLLTTRMVGNAPYFKTLSHLVPQSQPPPPPPQLPPHQEQQLVSQPQVDPTVVRYRECQKNHAAAMGSHVVDGCGEFMPNGEEGTAEALKCAACSCHRNFHRKEVEGELIHQSAPANGNNNNNNNTSGSRRREAANHNHHQVAAPFHPPRLPQRFPPLMMAFGSGGNGAPAESSSEHVNSPDGTPGTGTAALAGTPPSSSSRKRFRTKFNQEQKDKMQEFGERLGWKIQKQDEQQVQEFCAEVGVKRQVFKVWMHNSKQASKKKQL